MIMDQVLTKAIFNLPHTLLTDNFFKFLSVIGNTALVWWILMGIVLMIYEEKKHKEFIVLFTLTLLLTSFITSGILKNYFHRPRPMLSISKMNLNKSLITIDLNDYPSDFSFPSYHAAVSFAAAVVLSYFDKRRKKIFYITAILISFSRIYLGYHYFFDVIIGALIGAVIAKFILISYETWGKRITRSS